MELYLIRHADALPLGEQEITEDDHRPLSERGEKEAAALGKFLAKRGIRPDLVVTSPLLRAQKTAEIAMKSAEMSDIEVAETSALNPKARPKKLSRFLLRSSAERIAVVGHMPHLAEFVAWVIGGKKADIDFSKAGVAHVCCGDSPIKGNGVLHWLVTPEFFE
jgi:phosphohistidine phosphatase